MRFAAILDGTVGSATRQAQALSAFVAEGLGGAPAGGAPAGAPLGETFVFYRDERDRERLVELAPTRDVRLVKTAARRPEHIAEVLAAEARDRQIELFLLAAGGAGTELATRVAARSGGAVLSDALSVKAEQDCLVCRKHVYSNHLVGCLELRARPWCVSIAAGWNDVPRAAAGEHRVVADVDESRETPPQPFEDLELTDLPAVGDLAGSRFVVVAGYGAGNREGVERIARAARRMGAGLGVTRPVAMNAWAPMDRLIGVSGTRIAPALCIVVGASGAAALHWGIEKAAFIVAINLDERAAIVGNADVAVVDDGVATMEELADVRRRRE